MKLKRNRTIKELAKRLAEQLTHLTWFEGMTEDEMEKYILDALKKDKDLLE